jgi:uncharacterized protein (TIGR03437 family)
MASNVQAGKVDVKVMNNGALSAPFPVTAKSRAPAFFLWQGKYAVATHLDGTWCAKSGLFPGYPTTPAKPGEWIVFWGSGFAPTDLGAGGLTPAGQVISVRPVYAWVGTRGAEAYDQAAALAPGFAGLFQVAIQIPATTPDGDAMVRASSGASDWTPDGVFVTVRR